jgi:hypothetical protein
MKQYRAKRLQQLQTDAVKNRFGTLVEIGQTDYKQEVSNAPEDVFVIVFLYKQGYVPKWFFFFSCLFYCSMEITF